MVDDAVKAKRIKAAYFPYVKEFLRKPGDARFRVRIHDDLAVGELRLAPTDLTRFKREVKLRAHQRRTYNKLVRAIDSALGPLLKFMPLA